MRVGSRKHAEHRVVIGLVFTVVAVTAITTGPAWAHDSRQTADQYVAAPRAGTYPASNARIQGWINALQTDSIRRHGWNIWASITSPAYKTQPIIPVTPVWQTWYSGHEIFEMESGEGRVHARAVNGLLSIERRPAFGHLAQVLQRNADGIPFDPYERVFAFNRFSRSGAEFIYNNKLNSGNMFVDTLAALVRNRVPLASLAILSTKDSTDSSQFVIKPVFQFISGKEVTAVPYWNGDGQNATYDPGNPLPSRWRQAVAVDPSGRYKAGDSVYLPINNDTARWLKVVPLSAFYYVRVTKEDSAHFTRFGAENGDLIGLANDTSLQAVLNAARPGNIGLLMAMHVTGKEIPNWTWQSFWWGYNPADSVFGADRPKSIPSPWNHYNMTVAYYMTTPQGAQNIAFNPYLETSLGGKIPNSLTGADSTAWTGVTTNCMSCHRRAAIAWVDTFAALPPYGPDMLISAGDSLVFTQPNPSPGGSGRVPVLKTDFLWSVAIRASQPTPGKRPPHPR
jgi:hypothetical protein